MAEKEIEKDKSQDEGEKVSGKITVANETKNVTATKGQHLSDILKKFKEDNPKINLSDITVMYNGVPIEVNGGKLSYDPVILEGFIVTLLPKNIQGGDKDCE